MLPIVVLILFTLPMRPISAPAGGASLRWVEPTGTGAGSWNVWRAPGKCAQNQPAVKLATVTEQLYTDSTATPGDWCYHVTSLHIYKGEGPVGARLDNRVPPYTPRISVAFE